MTDTQNLTLSDEQISMIYAELAELHVELDDDPLLYGPKRLNGKIALTRKLLTRCEQIFLELSRRLHGCQREHRKHTALLDMAKQDLLANDPEVRAGRNIADRDAIAAIKLRPQIEQVQKLETATTDLETVLTVVKAKRLDIKDLQNRLKDQIKVCQDEIGLGARWGSAKPPSEATTELVTGQLGTTAPKVGAAEQIEAMFAEIDNELALDQAEMLPDPPASISVPADWFVKVDQAQETTVQDTPTAPSVEAVLVATATQAVTDDALDALDIENASAFSDSDFDLILG